MNHTEEIELHYAMLEYLFDKHKLATSCFGYAWEDFIIENPQHSHFTTNQLKTIFWTQVACNIQNYGLLTNDQKEYFDPDNFMINTDFEELQSVLENNEPKPGVDFSFWRSTHAYNKTHNETIQQQSKEEMIQTVKEIFEKPNICKGTFGADDDADNLNEEIEEASRINVIAEKPEIEIDCGEPLIEVFQQMMLTTEDVQSGRTELTVEEVFNRLANPDFEFEFSDGMKHFMKQFNSEILNNYIPQQTMPPPNVKRPVRQVTSTPFVPTQRQTRLSLSMSPIVRVRREAMSTMNSGRQRQKSTGTTRELVTSASDSSLFIKKNVK